MGVGGKALLCFALFFKNASAINVIYKLQNRFLLVHIKSVWMWSPTSTVLHAFSTSICLRL